MEVKDIAEYEENDSQLAKYTIAELHREIERLNNIINEVRENAKTKIKTYESYINDLKRTNLPSPTIRKERQELIFRIREQEELLEILDKENE